MQLSWASSTTGTFNSNPDNPGSASAPTICKISNWQDEQVHQLSRFNTMVLHSALSPRPVDSNTSKMYILENCASSRVFTSTIPYLSTNSKEVECRLPSPAARKSGRSRVSVRDIGDQEYPEASPTSITKSLLPAMTKCGSSSIWNDKQIVKSKIFLKRLNNAASIIQALARRMIQHKRYQEALIAKVEKEIKASCHKAATKLQALCRGGMFRTSFQVRKLELRLLQSDRLLKTQLQDIQKDKERQIAAIYKEYKAKKDSMETPAKDRKALIQKADETLTLLLKERKMLQSKNERLQKSISLCKKLERRLEQHMAGIGDESVNLKNIIYTYEKESSEWGHLADLYEGRIVEYEDMLEKTSDKRICENQVAKKTRESIVAIVSIVGDDSEDEELLRKVIELGETVL
jgi:K+/H+ antiporter YhaU regulatory subunit KhtT